MYLEKLLLISLLCFSLTQGIFAQKTASISELKKQLESSEDKAKKVELLDEMAKQLIYNQPQQAKAYAEQALQYAQALNDERLQAKIYNTLGITYDVTSDFGKALEFYHKAQSIFTKQNYLVGLTQVYNNIGIIYRNQGDFSQALNYYSQGLAISQKIQDTLGVGLYNQNIGYIKLKQKNTKEAMQFYNEALKSYQAIGAEKRLMELYYDMANTQKTSRNFEQAAYLLDKSKQLAQKYDDKAFEYDIYTEQARILLFQLKDLDKALELAQKSQAYYLQSRKANSYISTTNTVGNILGELGRYEEAQENLEKSLKLAKQFNIRESIVVASSRLAVVYARQEKYDKALAILEDNKVTWQQLNSVAHWADYYNALFTVCEANKDYEKAYKNLETFTLYKDSVYNIELAQEVNNLQLKQEQAEKTLLEKENQLKQELFEKENQQKELALLRARDAQNRAKILEVENTNKEAKLQQEKAENIRKEQALLLSKKEQALAEEKRKTAEIARKQSEEKRKTENFQNRLIIGTGATLLVLLGLLLLLFYRNYKQKQKANRVLTQKNEEIKTQNEEINAQKEEIQQQRDELEATLEQVQALDNFKQNMTHMIVHDLKNPLSAILGISNLEKERSPQVAQIHQSGQQMLNLVMTILDVQKFEETQVQLTLEQISAYEVAHQAQKELSLLTTQKNISIENQIPPQYLLEVDPDILRRVFVNLLSNAIKYSPQNSQILLSAAVEGAQIHLHIKDEGMGIPADFLPHIFEPYAQNQQRKLGFAGSTGLGLTFCRLAVEAHGGTISVESETQKGSTFTLSLALAGESESPMEVPAEVAPQAILLSTENQAHLQEWISELRKHEVFDYSSVEEVLTQIPDVDKEVEIWKSALKSALVNCNAEQYEALLNLNKSE